MSDPTRPMRRYLARTAVTADGRRIAPALVTAELLPDGRERFISVVPFERETAATIYVDSITIDGDELKITR